MVSVATISSRVLWSLRIVRNCHRQAKPTGYTLGDWLLSTLALDMLCDRRSKEYKSTGYLHKESTELPRKHAFGGNWGGKVKEASS